MWGAVVAFVALVKYAEFQFRFRLPFDISYLTLVVIIPQIFISIKEKKERKIKSYDDIAMDFIWLAFGISVFLLIHVNGNIAGGLEGMEEKYKAATGIEMSFQYYEYVLSLFLILYGLPTFITGAMFKFWPMFWGGILCWVSSILCVYTPVKADLLLVAASAVFAWLVPGILIQQDYVRAKKQLKQADV
jgi:uncharacterized protein with PQ loop repeat